MTVKQKLVIICVCDKCGHEWQPKKATPEQCPACKQYDWNKKQEKA